MKKNIRFLAILMIAIALVLIGCEDTLVDNIIITPIQEKITLNVDEVLDYDYKSLFTIKSGTSDIEVKDEYLDISNLKEETGTYIILCTYENKMASIYVEVIRTSNISLTLTKEEVIVNTDGEIKMYVTDGEYCAFKDFSSNEVLVTEGESCVSQPETPIIIVAARKVTTDSV